jgi:type IV pilus assembly protein PilV
MLVNDGNFPNVSRRTAAEKGFTLIEVLVAALVLSLGLLGLAGLQVMSLRNNQSAHFRSVATQAAYDMVDRMRANPTGLRDGNYHAVEAGTDDCVASVCTPLQMAGYDFARWSSRLAAELPLGTGTVCRDGTPETADCDAQGNAYAVKISWDDDRSGALDVNDPELVTSFLP